MVGSRVSSRMSSPVWAWMAVISRSWIRSRTGVPFQARPSPMWCRRPPWRSRHLVHPVMLWHQKPLSSGSGVSSSPKVQGDLAGSDGRRRGRCVAWSTPTTCSTERQEDLRRAVVKGRQLGRRPGPLREVEDPDAGAHHPLTSRGSGPNVGLCAASISPMKAPRARSSCGVLGAASCSRGDITR